MKWRWIFFFYHWGNEMISRGGAIDAEWSLHRSMHAGCTPLSAQEWNGFKVVQHGCMSKSMRLSAVLRASCFLDPLSIIELASGRQNYFALSFRIIFRTLSNKKELTYSTFKSSISRYIRLQIQIYLPSADACHSRLKMYPDC